MKNLITICGFLTILLAVTPGCRSLSSNESSNATNLNVNTANQTTKSESTPTPKVEPTTTAPAVKPTIEKADFTLTAEDFYKEYEKNGDKAQTKYTNKVVTVTGRLVEPSIENTSAGRVVRLKTVKSLDWVNCYFDEENSESFKKLREDQKVTLQGLGEEYWIGGPTLKRCIVVKAD